MEFPSALAGVRPGLINEIWLSDFIEIWVANNLRRAGDKRRSGLCRSLFSCYLGIDGIAGEVTCLVLKIVSCQLWNLIELVDTLRSMGHPARGFCILHGFFALGVARIMRVNMLVP